MGVRPLKGCAALSLLVSHALDGTGHDGFIDLQHGDAIQTQIACTAKKDGGVCGHVPHSQLSPVLPRLCGVPHGPCL